MKIIKNDHKSNKKPIRKGKDSYHYSNNENILFLTEEDKYDKDINEKLRGYLPTLIICPYVLSDDLNYLINIKYFEKIHNIEIIYY